jgi:hypothetical protein
MMTTTKPGDTMLLADRFTDIPTLPSLTYEQQREIAQTEEEIADRIRSLAPSGDYFVYPITYDARDLTVTMSGVARYLHPNDSRKLASAFVAMDMNNVYTLKTEITETREPGETAIVRGRLPLRQPGVGLQVRDPRHGYYRGLQYIASPENSNNPLKTWEQYVGAFATIGATLDRIEDANEATYGVRVFNDELTRDEMIRIRERGEPALADYAMYVLREELRAEAVDR